MWRALISFVFEYCFFLASRDTDDPNFGGKNGYVPVPHKGLRLLLQKKKQTNKPETKKDFRKLLS